jgi:hypothetical protein
MISKKDFSSKATKCTNMIKKTDPGVEAVGEKEDQFQKNIVLINEKRNIVAVFQK